MRMLMPAFSLVRHNPSSVRSIAERCRSARDGRGGTLDVLDADAPATYFPHGRYRRRIRLVARDEHTVLGGLEDDQHYFTVEVEHDGEHVSAITSASVRAPWTTCPAAGAQLQALVGAPLSDRCLEVAGHTRSDQHCTHQLDVATLAVAHAARVTAGGAERRQYDAVVPFGLLDGQRPRSRSPVTATRSWPGTSRAAGSSRRLPGWTRPEGSPAGPTPRSTPTPPKPPSS
jgi:hypothetical protein